MIYYNITCYKLLYYRILSYTIICYIYYTIAPLSTCREAFPVFRSLYRERAFSMVSLLLLLLLYVHCMISISSIVIITLS